MQPKDKCSRCGLCRELCRFKAISGEFEVDPLTCERCGVCYHACPEKAITFEEVVSGQWFVSRTPYGPLVHARLGIAAENSGKLVTLVRNKAKEIAKAENKEYNQKGPNLDYITFSGSGEPTLHRRINLVIDFIKDSFPQYRIAILTR